MHYLKFDFILLMFLALCISERSLAQQSQPETTDRGDQLISMDNPKKVARTTIQVDSDAADMFGETLGKYLKTARQVEAYKLSNFQSEETGEKDLMEGFAILDTRTISLERQQAISDLFISEEPYMEDKNMKNLCMFLPDMAFVFETEEQPVKALVSLDCKMVRFYFQKEVNDNRFIELNTKLSYQAFDQLYEELFGSTLKMSQTNAVPETQVKRCSTEENELVYKVKEGQGLSHVAKEASKQFDQKIKVKDICALNGIDRKTIIHTGQELIVGCLN